MVLDKKSLLECPINVVVPQGSILGPAFISVAIDGKVHRSLFDEKSSFKRL